MQIILIYKEGFKLIFKSNEIQLEDMLRYGFLLCLLIIDLKIIPASSSNENLKYKIMSFKISK